MIGNTHAMHHGGRRPGKGFKSKVIIEERGSDARVEGQRPVKPPRDAHAGSSPAAPTIVSIECDRDADCIMATEEVVDHKAGTVSYRKVPFRPDPRVGESGQSLPRPAGHSATGQGGQHA